ncbi:MAG: AraH, Ribose/xylose/arabinose/galactoside ABC-type transport system, permease component AraH [Subtercola sp.]|jgi:ribose transport system permease protein|nr:AraH, Ribose/xylose/arabinose/galactoside ABC-type transport system, permease component AraH [Subtercola sp.]
MTDLKTATTPPMSEPQALPRSTFTVMSLFTKYPMIWVLIALLILTTILYPGFWGLTNITNILTQNTGLILASVGMTFVIIARGFDLSVGAIFAAGAVFYVSMDGVMPVLPAVILSVLVGIVFGAINGALINAVHINPFVATLGTSSAFIGLMTLYAGASVKFSVSEEYSFLGTFKFGDLIPLSNVVVIVVFIIAAIVLAKTTFGRSIYAIGGNPEAARLSGIRVGLVSASTFVIIGGLAALGGVFTASHLGTAQPNFVGNMTLDAIAVVIIGGTSLIGGEGSMWRTAVGCAILMIVNNVFSSLNLEPALQLVFKGTIVVVAVAVDVWTRRRQSS